LKPLSTALITLGVSIIIQAIYLFIVGLVDAARTFLDNLIVVEWVLVMGSVSAATGIFSVITGAFGCKEKIGAARVMGIILVILAFATFGVVCAGYGITIHSYVVLGQQCQSNPVPACSSYDPTSIFLRLGISGFIFVALVWN
jgi:hypothetical protein